MAYNVKSDALRNNDKNAEAAIPFKGDRPPTEGPSNTFDGVYSGDLPGHADCKAEFLAVPIDHVPNDRHEQPATSGGHLFGKNRPE